MLPGLVVAAVLDGFADAGEGAGAVAGVGAGRVEEVLDPGAAGETIGAEELALGDGEVVVEGEAFRGRERLVAVARVVS